jgi:hypothetical protein
MWKSRRLEIQVGASVDECIDTFQSGITAPFGEIGANMTGIADKETLTQLRANGVYFQGRIHPGRFNVWCIEPGDVGRTSWFRPHYVGKFAETEGGTVLIGVIAVPWGLKALYAFFLVFSLLFISIGFGTGTYVLGIVGLGIALILSFFLVLNLSGAVTQWDDIPRNALSLFRDSTGGARELRDN